MDINFDTSRLPEKDLAVLEAASVRTLPTAGRHGEVMRRWRTRSNGDHAPPRSRGWCSLEQIDVEVRVTLRRSSWPSALLPPHESVAPVLIVRDTKQVVTSLRDAVTRMTPRQAALMPAAFKATPSRELLDALLELTFDAVEPKRSP